MSALLGTVRPLGGARLPLCRPAGADASRPRWGILADRPRVPAGDGSGVSVECVLRRVTWSRPEGTGHTDQEAAILEALKTSSTALLIAYASPPRAHSWRRHQRRGA